MKNPPFNKDDVEDVLHALVVACLRDMELNEIRSGIPKRPIGEDHPLHAAVCVLRFSERDGVRAFADNIQLPDAKPPFLR